MSATQEKILALLWVFTQNKEFAAQCRGYSKHVEASMHDALRKTLQQHHEHLREFGARDPFESGSPFSRDLYDFNDYFPQLHRKSIFVMMHALAEAELQNACAAVAEYLEVPYKKPRHDKMWGALSFLADVGGFVVDPETDPIRHILLANGVRNNIVHDGGVLPDAPDKSPNPFIASVDFLFGSPGRSVHLQPEFISSYLNHIDCLFEMLLAQAHAQTRSVLAPPLGS